MDSQPWRGPGGRFRCRPAHGGRGRDQVPSRPMARRGGGGRHRGRSPGGCCLTALSSVSGPVFSLRSPRARGPCLPWPPPSRHGRTGDEALRRHRDGPAPGDQRHGQTRKHTVTGPDDGPPRCAGRSGRRILGDIVARSRKPFLYPPPVFRLFASVVLPRLRRHGRGQDGQRDHVPWTGANYGCCHSECGHRMRRTIPRDQYPTERATGSTYFIARSVHGRHHRSLSLPPSTTGPHRHTGAAMVYRAGGTSFSVREL